MKLWTVESKYDKYMCTRPEIPFTFEQLHMFNGTKLSDNWVVPKLLISKGSSYKKCDFPYFSCGLPLVSKKALDILLPIITDSVEILPMDVEGEMYYGINVLRVLDVVDYDKTDHWFLPSGKIIVEKYAFHNCDELWKYNIFKVTDNTMTSIPFVSDIFKTTVEENKLKGFSFKLVCDSDMFTD
jgi:hypothetical protein